MDAEGWGGGDDGDVVFVLVGEVGKEGVDVWAWEGVEVEEGGYEI